jgi:phosphohistidine phosphatase SixA
MQRLYSPALCEILHLLLHPDPSHRPSAATLVSQLLGQKYPHSAERRSVIFPSSGLEEIIAQLRRENAELRSKAGSL